MIPVDALYCIGNNRASWKP